MAQNAAAGVAVQSPRLERSRVRRGGLQLRGWQDAAVGEAACDGGESEGLVTAFRERRAPKSSGSAKEDSKCCVQAAADKYALKTADLKQICLDSFQNPIKKPGFQKSKTLVCD